MSPGLEKSDHRSNVAVIVGGLSQVHFVQDASHMQALLREIA
jgi:hypothetical protein